ncbi:response regulator transcription factor [Anaerobacillus sp. CMMVII]|uniref:response regulator n=1 Tax=Anaerobacillus sp. CMMVII TaxID=2755588 RepID=UPI0021B7BD11|nr:response regulator transcription factor [Anaerobacillus sp. CMMVII]MCT8139274.1 response regulator transcription factor [Anaerobacillus sp. CMMVII]
MKQPFRVIIVDDHDHAREAIREIVGSYENFVIVGEATNGEEAIFLTEELMPDIILMDINMPHMDGLSATKIIKTKYPYIKVIIVTVSDEVTNLFEAIKKGAQGYLLKNINPTAWYEYLQAIADDEIPMSEELAFKLLQEFTSQKEKQMTKNPLSKREQEVLELVAKGHTNKQISVDLSISEHTVKNHLKNIMHKLHLENRVQITRYAYEKGWVE